MHTTPLEQRVSCFKRGVGIGVLVLGAYGCTYAQDAPTYKVTEVVKDKEHHAGYQKAKDESGTLQTADSYFDMFHSLMQGKALQLNERQLDAVKKYVAKENICCTIKLEGKPVISAPEIVAVADKNTPYLVRISATTGGQIMLKPNQFNSLVIDLASKIDGQQALVDAQPARKY